MNTQNNVTQVIRIDGMGSDPNVLPSEFEVRVLTEEYVQQTALALAMIFAQEEPLAIGTSTTPTAYFPYAVGYVKRCAQGGVSHIAVEKNSNMVVAFHLCSDDNDWEEPHSSDEGILLHLKLLDDLHDLYHNQLKRTNNTHELEKKTLKICSVGSYGFARQSGLVKKMFTASMDLARKLNYEQIMVECTGFASQRLYAKVGFVEVARLYYDNYEVVDYIPGENGAKIERIRKPFKTIPATCGDCCNLMKMVL
ncbi:predicted protein [Naegleria gruberi]|uniref:Predicted protein n=1 Tax=Naegleria gruberi TaxID=5762 RepID=D2V8Q2_NAEGR|nr:uncharacterized protein NAEGRDRAFT_65238 [Naegleria gruberi]EFC46841.1 predicted protein [Naegleria gruberi]|eukprot:XP_002679585.1 predicted protein [Naegleria gruberi strain NEG-M]